MIAGSFFAIKPPALAALLFCKECRRDPYIIAEIEGPVNVLISALFYSFLHKEIFPQDAHIVPGVK